MGLAICNDNDTSSYFLGTIFELDNTREEFHNLGGWVEEFFMKANFIS